MARLNVDEGITSRGANDSKLDVPVNPGDVAQTVDSALRESKDHNRTESLTQGDLGKTATLEGSIPELGDRTASQT